MENLIKKYKEDIKKNALCAERWKGANDSLYTSYMSRNQTLCEVLHDLEREQKQLETQATDLCQSVMPSSICLVTNETERTVESAHKDFEDAKKEVEDWRRHKPRNDYAVVSLELN